MKKSSRKTRYLIISAFLAVFFFALPTALVQAGPSSQSIAISPVSKALVINPGQTVNGTIDVINQGMDSYNYTVSVTPYSVSGENYDPSFTKIQGASDVTEWFSFNPVSSYLKSGDSQVINYTIQVPTGTMAGSYYAVIFAETQPGAITTTGIQAKKRVGTIFYLTITGKAKVALDVDSFTTPLFQVPPVKATLRLENDGSIFQDATYHITMISLLTGKTITINDSRYILQQTIRKMVIPWTGGPKLGLFKISGTVSFANQTLTLPARYAFVSSLTNLIILIVILTLIIALLATDLARRKSRKKNGSK